MLPLPFSHLFRSSRRCPRCARNTPKQMPDCQHCHELSDREVQALMEQDGQHAQAHGRMGVTMMVIAALLLGLILWSVTRS